MKIEDFRYMYRGKMVGLLNVEDQELLAPIDIKGASHDRVLLLLHGFTSSPAVYRRLIPQLTMYDAIVCPALPGHAESIDALSKIHRADWLASAERICQQLTETYQAVDVMGLSLGGLLACHLSTLFQLKHLFLLAPALSLRSNLTFILTLAKIAQRLGLRRIPNLAGNLYSSSHPELAYRQVPVTAIIEILTLIKEFQKITPTCPVDVFLGRHDNVVNSLDVAALFANIPETRLHWLEHSAHVLALDQDVDEILACIKEAFVC